MTILLPDPRVAAAPRRSTNTRRWVGPRLRVDLDAIAANTRTVAGRTGAEVMAVVKADGFGHGALDVARTALTSGATWLGVTSLDEAFALRQARIDAPLLSWLNGPDADWAGAAARSVDVAVPGLEHLEALVRIAPGARVHLHLDTGLARDGADPREWLALCRAAARAERRGLVRVVGLMGHLARADEPAGDRDGREAYAWGVTVARRCGLRPRHRHLAATAGALHDPRSHHTMVRVGAGLVGIDPARPGDHLLRGALTLTAPLVSVRRVAAGTPVGYGHTWVAPTPTTLGLVALGYADGLPRVASGRAEVQFAGRRRPVVGRISMDQVVVDLGDHGGVAGDEVTVLGPGDAGEPTVHDWARWSQTLPHEVVTGLGRRALRETRPTAILRSVG